MMGAQPLRLAAKISANRFWLQLNRISVQILTVLTIFSFRLQNKGFESQNQHLH